MYDSTSARDCITLATRTLCDRIYSFSSRLTFSREGRRRARDMKKDASAMLNACRRASALCVSLYHLVMSWSSPSASPNRLAFLTSKPLSPSPSPGCTSGSPS